MAEEKAVKKVAKKPTAKAAKTAASDEIAVIETGGKQYTVAVGDVIEIEKLPEAEAGKKVVFDKVLLVDDGKDATIGAPYIKGAKVEGVLEEEGKGKKVNVVHYKSKSRHFIQKGHRQPYARVKINALK